MHVAYIHQHFSTQQGATGTRSYEMARRLIARGHRVTMICGVNDATARVFKISGRVNEMTIDGIDVKCIAEAYSNRMGPARRIMAFLSFARTATRLVADSRADLVFATSTPLTVGIPGRKGARKLGVPFVFEVRDLWPEIVIALKVLTNPVAVWYMRRLERITYHAARRIVALAPGIKDGVVRTGYPAERVAMIPNGCDLDLFRPTDAPLDDPRFGKPGEFRLVFSGAHGLANGLDAVLDAAVELKKRGERGIRFVFIGEGGQKQRLMERSRQEGLGDLVTWHGLLPKDQLSRILPRMHVGMQILKNIPAFYYGTSPNKFFDYLSAGLPVLNNYPGWLAELIEHHRCGLAIPPDDPAAFAGAVVWMRDHPAELKDMGRRARELAEREFARDRLAAQFVEFLESAADAQK
ncbi:MAG TPA: glycosyltransferase family 4 protein [Phycisphaerae bacterium]|nr:glycosyltransferase family 4 protein [Phycisphaerae bacterium]